MKIIKSLLVVSTVVLSILLLAACEKTWQIDLGNSAECGGNIGKIEYKAISIIKKDSTEREVEDAISQKIDEGYDVALGIYEDNGIELCILVNTDRYIEEEAESIMSKLLQKCESNKTYKHDYFIDIVHSFMKKMEVMFRLWLSYKKR